MGLIPARAGNTARAGARRGYPRAHPRSRGEHAPPVFWKLTVAGSSPLARGTPDSRTHHGRAAGLIPARAGNTDQWKISEIHGGAHPRSRGEHCDTDTVQDREVGSSPLARGTLDLLHSPSLPCGLIPARAGNTQRWEHRARAGWAHPRSRGEHTKSPNFGA